MSFAGYHAFSKRWASSRTIESGSRLKIFNAYFFRNNQPSEPLFSQLDDPDDDDRRRQETSINYRRRGSRQICFSRPSAKFRRSPI